MTTVIYHNGDIYTDSQVYNIYNGQSDYDCIKAFNYQDHMTTGCGDKIIMYYFAKNETYGHKIRKFLMKTLNSFIWLYGYDVYASSINNEITEVIYVDEHKLMIHRIHSYSCLGMFVFFVVKKHTEIKGNKKNKVYFSIGSGSEYAMKKMDESSEDPIESMKYAIEKDDLTGGPIQKISLNSK